MGALKKIVGRKIYVDMTDIVIDPDDKIRSLVQHARKARARNKALKAIFPYQSIFGNRRIIEDPRQMQELVDEYFDSCMGPLRDKNGDAVLDKDGKPYMVQVRPYTLAGLALHLGMTTETLKNYNYRALAGVVHPEFSGVILQARQRIQQYTEERMFDRGGAKGAQFMLEARFNMSTRKDRVEIARNLAQIKKMQQDFELAKEKLKLQQSLASAAEEGDSNITINIVRATKADLDED